jgi:hypothetical protein
VKGFSKRFAASMRNSLVPIFPTNKTSLMALFLKQIAGSQGLHSE